MNRTTAKDAITARLEQETANFDIAKKRGTSLEPLANYQTRISVLTWAMDATAKEIENHLNLVKIQLDRDIANPAVRPSSINLSIAEFRTLQEVFTIKTHLA